MSPKYFESCVFQIHFKGLFQWDSQQINWIAQVLKLANLSKIGLTTLRFWCFLAAKVTSIEKWQPSFIHTCCCILCKSSGRSRLICSWASLIISGSYIVLEPKFWQLQSLSFKLLQSPHLHNQTATQQDLNVFWSNTAPRKKVIYNQIEGKSEKKSHKCDCSQHCRLKTHLLTKESAL